MNNSNISHTRKITQSKSNRRSRKPHPLLRTQRLRNLESIFLAGAQRLLELLICLVAIFAFSFSLKSSLFSTGPNAQYFVFVVAADSCGVDVHGILYDAGAFGSLVDQIADEYHSITA